MNRVPPPDTLPARSGLLRRLQLQRPLGADGGNGVLIDQILLPVGGEHHDERIKSADGAPHLEAVHQEHGDGTPLPAGLGEEDLLKVVDFLHMM